MKKIATVLLLTFLSANLSAHNYAQVTVYNNGISSGSHYYLGLQPFSELISPTDSAIITAKGRDGDNATLLITNNSNTIWSGPIFHTYEFTLTVTDTGHYVIHFASDFDNWDWNFNLSYFPTTGIEEAKGKPFLIAPTLSSGIFKITGADKNLKNLLVTDSAGRTVLATSTDFSEINLTRFSSGIYFYAITDDKKKVWRGKIVKE